MNRHFLVVEMPVVDANCIGNAVDARLHGRQKVVLVAARVVRRIEVKLDVDLANDIADAELLRRLEGEARAAGARRMFLEVRVSNAAAMMLYLRAGYVGRYARPRYYGDGEDALVMEKKL